MPFNSSQDVETRLANPAPLSSEEIRDLFPWMNQISESGMRRLNSQLALQDLEAIRKFERSSSALTTWLVWLTVVLVVLTIVIAAYTIVLARKESPPTERPVISQSAPKKSMGPWTAKFVIPGTAVLPSESPIVKCSVAKSPDSSFGFVSVTVQNLTEESHTVRYSIYGYDQKGRRISQGSDEFAIGKHETVLRSVFLKSEESVLGKLGSQFVIQMMLEN